MTESSSAPIAYVLWKFPKLSETFVVEELLALERRGLLPVVIACERPDEQRFHPGVPSLTGRTVWIGELSRSSRLAACAATVARHPWRFISCARSALRSPGRVSLANLGRSLVVARIAEQRGIRYLHAHFADVAGEIACSAARLAGVRFGVTIHGADIYVRPRTLRLVVGSASLRVTVCEYNVTEIVRRCPGTSRSDFLIKYAGVDTKRVRLPSSRPKRPGRQIVAVGRLVPKKGFGVLLQAISLLALTFPTQVSCVIVGSGPEEAELRSVASRLGIAGQVDFLGDRSPGEVLELMAAADVLAAPCTISAWGDRDSMPVVLKEAMALELPVVASDDFGIPELVTAATGLLVPRDDPEALAAALAQVLRMPAEQRAAMGQAGRAVVEERFCEDAGAELLVRAFYDLLGDLPARSGT